MGFFDDVLGLGSKTEANVAVDNKKVLINENIMNMMTQNINKSTSDIVNRTMKGCEMSSSTSQVVDNEFGEVAGDYNSGPVTMDMSAKVSMKCLQDSNMRTDLIKDVAQQITNTLKENMESSALDKLTAAAKATKEQGFLSLPSMPGSDVVSNTNISNDITQENRSMTDLTNIIVNETANNFTNENMQKCFQSANAEQVRKEGAQRVGGDVNIAATTMTLTTDVVLNCVQKEQMVNQILEKATTKMGMSFESTKGLISKTAADALAETKNKAEGLFAGLEQMKMMIIVAVLGCMIVGVVLIIGIVVMSRTAMKEAPNMMKAAAPMIDKMTPFMKMAMARKMGGPSKFAGLASKVIARGR